jgi:hypothetical protein
VDEFLAALTSIANRGPFVTIADARHSTSLDAALRRKLFEGLGLIHAKGNWLAEAIVLDSPVLRGIVTAYSWVRAAKAPLRVFATPEEADAWTRELLQRLFPKEKA